MSTTDTIRRGFVTGVVLLAPLAVTVFVVRLVYGWLVSLVAPLVAVAPGITSPFAEPLALAALFAAVTVVGVVVRHGIGDTVVRRFDHLMEAIPGISVVYSSVRQASTALTSHEDRFERVALVHLDSELRTVGFVTSETPATLEGTAKRDEPYYDVFVPMAPNPMGGFLAVVPENRLTMTDLSVREALQVVVTTGMSREGGEDLDEFGFSDGA